MKLSRCNNFSHLPTWKTTGSRVPTIFKAWNTPPPPLKIDVVSTPFLFMCPSPYSSLYKRMSTAHPMHAHTNKVCTITTLTWTFIRNHVIIKTSINEQWTPELLFKEIQKAKISEKINVLGQFKTSLKNKPPGRNIQVWLNYL